jgi:hypothetical protein
LRRSFQRRDQSAVTAATKTLFDQKAQEGLSREGLLKLLHHRVGETYVFFALAFAGAFVVDCCLLEEKSPGRGMANRSHWISRGSTTDEVG